MATTSTNNFDITTTADVTIRIPCRTGSDLVTETKKRLSRAEGVAGVTIDELHSLDPKLSATHVTVGVTIQWTTRITDTDAKTRLANVPGLESVTFV
ncbi:hypothetical protein [Halogranum rubrum]|uniref:hypothetical protein n=1 Tax=Halogranum rubrum TaxID=553466 RepID=UPI001160B06A|nr:MULTISPECIES: hypothetical protein [Halogranum]